MSNENRVMMPSDAHPPGDDLPLPPAEGGQGVVQAPHTIANRQSLLHLLHLSLRGRYWLVIPLSLVMAAAGAFAGWKYFYPKYRSIGRIQILEKKPTISRYEQTDYNDVMPDYEEFMNTQIGVITSQDRILDALHDPEWLKSGRGSDHEAMKKFVDNLTVEHPHQTQLLNIALLDADPVVAATGTKAIVRIYKEWYDANDAQIYQRFYKSLNDDVAVNKSKIEVLKHALESAVAEYGSEDFDMLIHNDQQQIIEREKQIEGLKSYLSKLESSVDPSDAIDRYTPVEIGMFDQRMERRLDAVTAARARVEQLKVHLGDNHVEVFAAQKSVDAALQEVSDYAQQWRDMQRKHPGHINNDVSSDRNSTEESFGLMLERTPDAVKKQIADCETRMKAYQDEMTRYSTARLKIRSLNEQLATQARELDDAQAKLARYQIEESRGIERLIVLNSGEIPIVPFKDPRKAAAAGLGFAGMMLPILLFVFIGMADRRFRFSEQADRDGAGLPPLLGILPTLPDRMEDAEPAARAAHCVHQLRIMLQVNTTNSTSTDGALVPNHRAYVITSASPGDGKTSLTMALGLSYAASGSRTLVIDCDMVGQGLTNRLKANSSEGLLEALQAGTLAGRVKKTTTANLYILPLGGAESSHAGAISPQAIRKLLVEARRIFDVIIIDTGPILGSLEAQVVSAAADSVILTVARGQQQPLVQRALRMLRQVGANVGGMVFNRAQARDFSLSVTSSSYRSISSMPPARRALLSEGAEESRFGPLARSVASFMPMTPPVKPVTRPADEIRVEVVSRDVPSPASEDTVFGMESPKENADDHEKPQ